VYRYVESAQCLSRETNLDLNKFEVCDNVSLETVLMEYIAYYRVKFSKDPKITKKLANPTCELSIGCNLIQAFLLVNRKAFCTV